jgi:hypothetical protein
MEKVDLFETGDDMQEAPKENAGYERYRECGGIINEKDYESILARAKNTTTPDRTLIKQAELVAQFAGIELHNTKESIDQRTALYGILRSDAKPEHVAHHYSQKSDQRLLAEALRMLGDTDALNKLTTEYHTKGSIGTRCPICGNKITPGGSCR